MLLADPTRPPPAPCADLAPDWLAGRFEPLGALGAGGAGAVFRMRERATGRVVAVKVAGDAPARAQLAREAALAGRLRHPRVLTVELVRGPAGALALASPYADGGTLRAAADAARAAAGPDARAPLGYARTAAVLRDVAAALAHAHASGVVHADVKPENVFLDAAGRALLADFGIAHRPGRPGDGDGAVCGTPAYMAPEQVAGGPLDPRTDVYALGLVGWELLAGRRPWEGLALEAVLHAQRADTLPPLAELCPDVPAYLLAAVDGALAKDPAARWADAGEMLRRLTPTPAALPVVVPMDRAALSAATVRLPARGRSEQARDGVPGPRGAAWGRTRRAALATLALCGAAGLLHAVGRAPAATARGAVGAPVAGPPVQRAAVGAVVAPAVVARRLTAHREPCGAPSGSARRDCERPRAATVDARGVAASDARVATAVAALDSAIRAAAPDGWEPAAAGQLRAEQRRWAAARRRACGSLPEGSRRAGADAGAAGDACRAEWAARRADALRARRARFSPSIDWSDRQPE